MAKKPNILLFFPDQYHADWQGFDPGIPVRTPNLRKLAAGGVRFTDALCPSPLCAPSRAALASGREYPRCGVSSNRENYPVEQTTFYSLLRESGYHVMGCGKFDLHKPDFSWGSRGRRLLHQWGFSDGIDSEGKIDGLHAALEGTPGPYLTYLQSRGVDGVHIADFKSRTAGALKDTLYPTELDDEHYCDNWIARNGLELIRAAPKEKPWFLQVNFAGPHAPMDITENMKSWYADAVFRLPAGSTKLKPREHMEILRNYAAMIENIDRRLGVYVDYLKRSGEFRNTMIVFSSDHGEMLGAEDSWGKGRPKRASVNVPLVFAGAGVTARGGEVHGVHTTLDLTATFLEIAGIDVPDTMDSRSLLPVLADPSVPHRRFVRSALRKHGSRGEITDWSLVYDGRFKLVRGGDGSRVLWDISNDPDESINLAGRMPEIAASMEKYLYSPGDTP